jgi:hypothetical protein
MMVSIARVPEEARISWRILEMAMRIESEAIRPTLTQLSHALEELRADILEMTTRLNTLVSDVTPVLQNALALKADTLWDDTYNLCGNSRCDGGCRVCQQGEEDYEEDDTEKYCRRRRR